ncbi:MAG TPA: RNA polymerase subunit sigma-24 [Verrucomicrobiales bacterium]|nr:RNA polymerase subunit sigma-24 [Verrucomicrobiales bacterium]
MPEPDADRCGFDTTHWSLVARAADPVGDQARKALEELCRIYWRPVYSEIRRRGHDVPDAEDLTQEFFTRLLRNEMFGRADRQKGRFRSYLLAALNHFLADDWRQKIALRRGGGEKNLPLDTTEGEAWFLELPARCANPAEAFDQSWALVLMERALLAQREEYERRGQSAVFAALQPFLAADTGADGYADAAATAGMTAPAFAVAVHRLRKRFRAAVRAHVEMTVADPEQAADEMRQLFGI